MADDPHAAKLDFEANVQKARLPLRAWLRLFVSSTLIEQEISARLKARFGVSLARFDYLAQLDRSPNDGMTMGELGQCLMVTGGSITGLTDRLEADDLVVRRANQHDRRSHMIVLTDNGRRVFAGMAKAHESWVQEIFSSMNEADLTTLMAGLDKIKTGIRLAAGRRRGTTPDGS